MDMWRHLATMVPDRAALADGAPRVTQWLSTKADTPEAKRTVSLSLAPWFVALGTDTERVRSVDRADLAGRRRVAFEASRRCRGTCSSSPTGGGTG